ncbi:MAG: hypothetical protein ACREE6_02375, partial [Limisphaerales bacterium]
DYIAAASFAILGQNTFAGRAPFAFIGWLSVLLLGFVVWKIYRKHRVALGAMLLLGTSEVFLLHIRQCRYYSMTVLAEILLVYGVHQILVKNKRGAWFILSGLLLQFYCNYVCALANVPFLVVLVLRSFRQERAVLPPLFSCFGIFLLATVPWLLFAETWRQRSVLGRDTPFHILHFYAWQFHFHFFPWCFLLLPLGAWIARRFNAAGRTSCPVGAASSRQSPRVNALAAAERSQDGPALLARHSDAMAGQRFNGFASFESHLLLLMVLYVPVLLVMPVAFSRYMLPVLPIGCLLVAAWLFRYIKWTAAACAILLAQCLSNVLAVATDPFGKEYPLRSPIADVLFSSLLPYEDRLTDLLKFFGNHARPGDTLVSWDPEFPLAFYTHLKIIDARLTPEPFHPLPNWVLPESATGDLYETHELPDALKSRYEKITLSVHNSAQVDTIPEPEAYELQTAGTMSPFVIYKLKLEN